MARLAKYTKTPWSEIQARLSEIEKVLQETGQIKCVAKYLGIVECTFRNWRRCYSELDKLVNDTLQNYNPYFSDENLLAVESMLKEGKIRKQIAKYLNISESTIRWYAQRNSKLQAIIDESKKVTFDKKTLEEVERIAFKGLLKDVNKYLGITHPTRKIYCQQYPELKAAIDRGLAKKKKYKPYNPKCKLKLDFIEYNLMNVEKIMTNTGSLCEVAKLFCISDRTLFDVRKKYKALEEAVQSGFAQYKANKKVAKLSGSKKVIADKPVEIYKFKKPAKELVAQVGTIASLDQEEAIIRFRRMKEAQKEAAFRKQAQNMDLIGM